MVCHKQDGVLINKQIADLLGLLNLDCNPVEMAGVGCWILSSTHATSQINYSPTRYIMRSDLNYFVNRAHAGLEDDECDLESWIYRLESAWGLYAG
jgi:hypothetical protein